MSFENNIGKGENAAHQHNVINQLKTNFILSCHVNYNDTDAFDLGWANHVVW